MIKIISGFTGAGGSTVVFNTLVNLFNEAGMPSCLYGPYRWKGINCQFREGKEFMALEDDHVIYHYLQFQHRFNCKKQILSCHETGLFRIDRIKNLKFDTVHFVSQFQKDWHAVPGTVIPNPIRKFTKVEKTKKVAGIIGSIDANKRVHLSIQRALNDGFDDIRLYGGLTDYPYFIEYVSELLSDKVTYRGIAANMDEVYKELSHVYHSPRIETFNLIKPECEAAGVIYVGDEGNDSQAEYWDNDKILESWKKLLSY